VQIQRLSYIKQADHQITKLYRKEIEARRAGDVTLARVLRRKRKGLMALRGDYIAKVPLTKLKTGWQPV